MKKVAFFAAIAISLNALISPTPASAGDDSPIPLGVQKLQKIFETDDVSIRSLQPAPNLIVQDPQELISRGNRLGEMKAIVRFYVFNGDLTKGLASCSGALIASDMVATARHCLDVEDKNAVGVVLSDDYRLGDIKKPSAGTWALTKEVYDICLPGWCREPGVVLKTDSPDFDSVYYRTYDLPAQSDIVILRLDRKFEGIEPFSIHPASMPLPSRGLMVAGFPAVAMALLNGNGVKHISDENCVAAPSGFGGGY